MTNCFHIPRSIAVLQTTTTRDYAAGEYPSASIIKSTLLTWKPVYSEKNLNDKKLSGSLKILPTAGPVGQNTDRGPQSQPRYGVTVVNDSFRRIPKKQYRCPECFPLQISIQVYPLIHFNSEFLPIRSDVYFILCIFFKVIQQDSAYVS